MFGFAHTNPEYWQDPLEFNPDRFSDEMFAKRSPYTYVPFSAGNRNCQKSKVCYVGRENLCLSL